MTGKNKYAKRSRISEHQIRQIARLFSIDLEATQIAKLTGLNRNTINRYLKGIRQPLSNIVMQKLRFLAKLKLTNRSSEHEALKAKGAAVLSAKRLFLASSMKRSCSFRDRSGLQKKLLYNGPLEEKSLLRASSIPLAGVAITGWST